MFFEQFQLKLLIIIVIILYNYLQFTLATGTVMDHNNNNDNNNINNNNNNNSNSNNSDEINTIYLKNSIENFNYNGENNLNISNSNNSNNNSKISKNDSKEINKDISIINNDDVDDDDDDDDYFMEAENCSAFDINCLEMQIASNNYAHHINGDDSNNNNNNSNRDDNYGTDRSELNNIVGDGGDGEGDNGDNGDNRGRHRRRRFHFKYQCSLRNIKRTIFWWQYSNGTLTLSNYQDHGYSYLDLSFRGIQNDNLHYEVFKHRFDQSIQNVLWNIQVFSLAGNLLTTIPYETLHRMRETLICLSLKGNNLGNDVRNINDNDFEIGQNQILYFPKMIELKVLDLSNCNIQGLHWETFMNLTKLESLFLSQNKIILIDSRTFIFVPNLRYLDLSHIDSITIGTSHTVPTVEAYLSIFEGLAIAEDALAKLKNLEYLDFSYTRLARSSVKAFSHLGKTLKYLSLCFTSIPIIGKGIFFNTTLKAVDLSGNAYAAYYIGTESFEGIDDTIEYLSFEKSNIKSLGWLRNLRNLKVLKLGGNNINTLNNETFKHLNELQLLDLSSNHIGVWYYRVFENNKNLMVLNLRQNNINLISPEMYKDFSNLAYLAIGRNNFVCDCMLRGIIDVAARNNHVADCIKIIMYDGLNINETKNYNILLPTPSTLASSSIWPSLYERKLSFQIDNNEEHNNIIMRSAINSYQMLLKKSHINMMKMKKDHNLTIYNFEYNNNIIDDIDTINGGLLSSLLPPTPTESTTTTTTTTSTITTPTTVATNIANYCKSNQRNPTKTTNSNDPSSSGSNNETAAAAAAILATKFNFQLLDYTENDYWCYNDTEQLELIKINGCNLKSVETDLDDMNKNVFIIYGLIFMFGIMFLSTIAYYKRWKLYYYYFTLKNAAALKFYLKKDPNNNVGGSGGNNKRDSPIKFSYDIFVSYSDIDREWVLQELLPNIEDTEQVTVCLHERDFQVGMTILENIISCMDKSRCILLIVSKSFLASQWCLFELNLAQHRLIEIKRENLILILLEDIPKFKQPRTLQYLMHLKTYIKWPNLSSSSSSLSLAEERKLFWKRLKKSLVDIRFNK